MIIKSLSRKSNSGQLVKYLLRYMVRARAQDHANENVLSKQKDATVILRHNIRAKSVKGIIQQYRENEKFRIYRRVDSITLFHSIISFSPFDKEKVTDNILKAIAKKYIELRGSNNLFLCVSHKDKDHPHMHILVSGTQLNGYSSRVSKQQFNHIKLELEKYTLEKHPQLIHSFTEHGRRKRKTREEIIEHVKVTRQTDKQTLLEVLDKTYTKATSQQEFFTQLTAQGYDPYYRNNKCQGVLVEDRKFRLNRLGYDEQKINDLDYIRNSEQKALSDLKNLRAGRKKTIGRTIFNEAKNEIESTDRDFDQPTLFDELQEIRNRREDQEIDERMREIDTETSDQFEDENYLETDEDEALPSPFRGRQNQELLDYEYDTEL